MHFNFISNCLPLCNRLYFINIYNFYGGDGSSSRKKETKFKLKVIFSFILFNYLYKDCQNILQNPNP